MKINAAAYYIDYFIETEKLEQDFVYAMQDVGIDLSLQTINTLDLTIHHKTHRSLAEAHYYDADDIAFVQEKDQWLSLHAITRHCFALQPCCRYR